MKLTTSFKAMVNLRKEFIYLISIYVRRFIVDIHAALLLLVKLPEQNALYVTNVGYLTFLLTEK